MKDYDYNVLAQYYDILELDEHQEKYNKLLAYTLKKYHVKTVLDLTCGTGVQSIYLHKHGFTVTASDASRGMLTIARKKAPSMKFSQGDMRVARYGQFDAVITMFNAIAHLKSKDFEKALHNVHANLKPNGIYVFDIFNLDYMLNNFMTYEYIDTATFQNGKYFVRFNKNTLNKRKGIMSMHQTTYIQEDYEKPRVVKEFWHSQIYTLEQLKDLLKAANFTFLQVLDVDGTAFDKKETSQMRIVARKK